MIGGQSNPVELEIYGDRLETLDDLILKVYEIAGAMPGIRDPDTSVRPGKPEIRILPRRAVLSDLGMPAVPLGLTLRANLEGIKAATFKQDARSYDIVVKLAEQQGKDQVPAFQLAGTDGHPLVLTNVSRIEQTEMPVQIIRKTSGGSRNCTRNWTSGVCRWGWRSIRSAAPWTISWTASRLRLRIRRSVRVHGRGPGWPGRSRVAVHRPGHAHPGRHPRIVPSTGDHPGHHPLGPDRHDLGAGLGRRELQHLRHHGHRDDDGHRGEQRDPDHGPVQTSTCAKGSRGTRP
jgi:hypothetical protein